MQVSLSQIKSLEMTQAEFESAVQAFLQAKKDHLATEGEAAPTAHHLIEACVRRVPAEVLHDENGEPLPDTMPDDFVAEFSIIDDLPPPVPPPTLEQRKMALAAEVGVAATAALNVITPPLKAKSLAIQVGDAMRAKPTGKMTEVQAKILADHEERTAKADLVHRHHADLESQIHDLPEDMLDVWKPAPFPT